MKLQETICNSKKQYATARNNMNGKKQYATARNNMQWQETI